MTPTEAACQAVTEKQTRWERNRDNRERLAREREGMTCDSYVARWDDPEKQPWVA